MLVSERQLIIAISVTGALATPMKKFPSDAGPSESAIQLPRSIRHKPPTITGGSTRMFDPKYAVCSSIYLANLHKIELQF
jgi:hypothetical protein